MRQQQIGQDEHPAEQLILKLEDELLSIKGAIFRDCQQVAKLEGNNPRAPPRLLKEQDLVFSACVQRGGSKGLQADGPGLEHKGCQSAKAAAFFLRPTLSCEAISWLSVVCSRGV